MRHRSIFAVSLISSLSGIAGVAALVALPGCEDGPSQTFTAAPANAGNLWNNGNPNPSVADGGAKFDAQFGSVNALEHCTADQQRLVWANMLQQPMIPPLQYAGLNLAYDERFDGITLKEAEAINCTGLPNGPGGVTWGDNGEVAFFYTTSNYVINQIDLNLGYLGKMVFHQAVGQKNAAGDCAIVSRFENAPTQDPDTTHCTGHTYEIQLGQPILKDGNVLEIDWQNSGYTTVANEIFNAMMATFGQGAIGWVANADYDSADCTADGSCLVFGPADAAGNGGECFIGYLPLAGLGIATNCTTAIQPTVSIPINISQFYYLSEPYSYEASVAQISAQGPVSLPRFNVAADPTNCFVQVGMDWTTYLNNCVDLPGGTAIDTAVLDAGLVTSPDGGPITTALTINQVNENKALAAHTHDNETYQFNIVGVGLNWTDEEVAQNPQAIVQDTDLPSRTDTHPAIVNSWGTNLYDKGTPINDTVGSSYTGQGSAYVYRQWAQLVQADLNKILAAANPTKVIASGPNKGQSIYNHVIGDPACFVPPAQANAAGCTGMEGLILQSATPTTACAAYGDPADQCATNPAPICANYGAYCPGGFYGFGDPGYGATVLRPGGVLAVFCQNPPGVGSTTDPLNGSCNIYQLWPGALTQVQTVAGLGNLFNLPQEIADVRYYFRWYGIAIIQYLKAYGANPAATAADIAAQTIDLESIFFDTYNNGGGGYNDQIEYVERTFMQNMPETYVGNKPAQPGATGAVTVSAAINSFPTDFSLNAILLSADEQGSTWNKFLYRGEKVMFQAMLESKGDLPGQENNVNMTSLAGSTLLQGNYASWECATQYPLVTIPVGTKCYRTSVTSPESPSCSPSPLTAGGACAGTVADDFTCTSTCTNPGSACTGGGTCTANVVAGDSNNYCINNITGSWQDLCQGACTNGPDQAGVPCPTPPLNPPDSNGIRSLQLDLNGSNPGLGSAGMTVHGTTNARLGNYKGVWGGGAACPNGTTPNYELNPTGAKNPYGPGGCQTTNSVTTGVGSIFAVGHRPQPSARLSYVGADATHLNAGTDPNTLTAFVNVPDMPNPYNAITPAGKPTPANIQATMSWVPAYDGIGLTVPINAQLDKFYQTQTIDFSGILLSYSMDVVPWTDPITHVPDGTLTIYDIQGGDFLGEVFLCQDIGGFPTPGTGDLLGAHMYDSAGAILQWITDHPGSEDSCNIIVRYSVYDNYVDVITSLTAGVQIDINQGGGYGRVVGATVFDPALSEAP